MQTPFTTGGAAYVPNTATAIVTCPAGETYIRIGQATVHNVDAAPQTITVWVMDAAGVPTNANRVFTRTLSAGESYSIYVLASMTLEAGNVLYMQAGASSAITYQISGLEITQ